MEIVKIAALVLVFLLIVGALGLLAAKINGVDLSKDPSEMKEESFVLYVLLRPIWVIARWLGKPFRKS